MPPEKKQKYRYTFSCSEHGPFKKISTRSDLETSECPECKKGANTRVTRHLRMGDGPVSDSDLKKTEFQKTANVVYKCDSCDAKIRIFEEVGSSLQVCPACDSKEIKFVCHIDKWISQAGRVQNKAIDETANICMEDYKLTNLKDNVRTGDVIAPSLPPVLQQKADTFFSPKKPGGNSMTAKVMANLGRKALAGSFSPQRTGTPDVIARQHQEKIGRPAFVSTTGDKRIN